MKKTLLNFSLLVLFFTSTQVYGQRFVTEVFTSTSVTQNVLYGWNISVIKTDDDTAGHTIPIPGAIVYNDSLRADIYEPVGDTMAARPTVIMLHTGSFIPIFYNGQTTGQRIDSTIVEMCKQFARRGYTAIAIDYRKGWNPTALGAPGQEIRTGSLLQAAGRGIQDAKAAVRYFRNSALNSGNPYHIDESKIILGGSGTGGYIALGYATIDSYAEISIPKFTAINNNLAYGFMADSSYFAQSLWGDFNGYGGQPFFNNSNNTPGIPDGVSFVFNMGGAMGDSSWQDPGDIPVVCFHPSLDPFAPFGIGNVIVPVTGDFVIEAFGSQFVVHQADSMGNNYRFQHNTWTDPYTTRANLINNGDDGLFPFELRASSLPPFLNQAGPWEWWDSSTVYFVCMNVLGFTQGRTDSLLANSWVTNNDMSRAKGIAYIDTIMGYLNPRINAAVINVVGVPEIQRENNYVLVYPNPARDNIHIYLKKSAATIEKVTVMDISGRTVYEREGIKDREYVIPRSKFTPGMYFVKVQYDKFEAIKMVSIQ